MESNCALWLRSTEETCSTTVTHTQLHSHPDITPDLHTKSEYDLILNLNLETTINLHYIPTQWGCYQLLIEPKSSCTKSSRKRREKGAKKARHPRCLSVKSTSTEMISGSVRRMFRNARRICLPELYKWMRFSREWMRFNRVWMRFSIVLRWSDCQCRSRNSPRLNTSILRPKRNLRGSRWSSF